MTTITNWSRRFCVGLVAAVALLALSSPAFAQDADVAVLVTEVVHPDGDDEQIRFWWSDADQPQWTDSDNAVFRGLDRVGVRPLQPERVDISRIYRRPGLSAENAAQLGRLLGVDQVLVGTLEYRPVGPVAPLGLMGVEAHAEVTLVPAGNSEAVALDKFEVTRQVFGDGADELLDEARADAGEALGEMMGQSFRRATGQVGLDTEETLLAFRDVEHSAYLNKIRERLEELEEVDRVVKRWAAEGVIAVEVQPGEDGVDDEVADYARRVLENHDFEQFDVVGVPAAEGLDGVHELWLETGEGRM